MFIGSASAKNFIDPSGSPGFWRLLAFHWPFWPENRFRKGSVEKPPAFEAFGETSWRPGSSWCPRQFHEVCCNTIPVDLQLICVVLVQPINPLFNILQAAASPAPSPERGLKRKARMDIGSIFHQFNQLTLPERLSRHVSRVRCSKASGCKWTHGV